MIGTSMGRYETEPWDFDDEVVLSTFRRSRRRSSELKEVMCWKLADPSSAERREIGRSTGDGMYVVR